MTTSLRDQLPSLADSAIDGSDMTAYVNGPRYVSKGGRERERLSDPDASWGGTAPPSRPARAGGFYDYKIDAAVCTAPDLPPA